MLRGKRWWFWARVRALLVWAGLYDLHVLLGDCVGYRQQLDEESQRATHSCYRGRLLAEATRVQKFETKLVVTGRMTC